MFKITVEGSTLDELAANLALAAVALTASPVNAAEALGVKPAAAKPAAAKPKPKTPTLDYDTDVRPLVVKVSKDEGREKALEILGEFTNESTGEPCTKGQEVSESDWPALIEACNAALNEVG